MKSYADFFCIDGRSMFAPDEDVVVSYADLDGDDSGRDEAGFMHRVVVRHKVGTWSFEYSNITDEEYRYMESLFGDKPYFMFYHPDRLSGECVTTQAYRSNYGIVWHNAKTGQWRNYKFNIIEC